MAKQVKLTAERREATGRSAIRKLKARGIVPAIVYGGKDKAQSLQVSRRDISLMLSHASGENILVELEIAGEKGSRMAMIQEIQHSPVGGDVLHVDFHAVSMDQKIEADIPLEASGTANGVKNFGGLLEQNLRALAVECLPRDLPDKITVDVSALNIGDSRTRICGHAPQRRLHGGRSSCRPVWIELGEIHQVGRADVETRRYFVGETDEFHESQRLSARRRRAVLQNCAVGNSGGVG